MIIRTALAVVALLLPFLTVMQRGRDASATSNRQMNQGTNEKE